MDSKQIHEPWLHFSPKKLTDSIGYVGRIVDHDEARKRALSMYKEAYSTGNSETSRHINNNGGGGISANNYDTNQKRKRNN